MIGQVNHASSFAELWQILVNLFAQTSLVKVLQLKPQLATIQKDDLSICNYIQKVKTIGDSFKVGGHPISEKDLVLNTLSGLGTDYDSVVCVISYTMQSATLQDIQYYLMMHETRLEQQIELTQLSNHTTSANMAQYNRDNRQTSRHNNRCTRLYCQLCHKQGHDAFKCNKHFDVF